MKKSNCLLLLIFYLIYLWEMLQQGMYSLKLDNGMMISHNLIVNRWSLDCKPHFVSDSAFGSFSEMMEVMEWGSLWTTAMPVNTSTSLWNMLSYNCPPNTWQAAINEHGIVASSHTLEAEYSHKMVTQQVLSSGFNASVSPQYTTITGDSGMLKYVLIFILNRNLSK